MAKTDKKNTQKMENLLALTHSKARVERGSFRSGD